MLSTYKAPSCLYNSGMRVLYIDSLFLFELAADYTMLWAAGKLCGVPRKFIRLISAAVLGASYSVVSVLYLFPAALPVKICMSVIMLLVAYGGEKRLATLALALWGMSAIFAGLTVALSVYTARALILSLCISVGVCSIPFRFTGRGGKAEVLLKTKYGQVSFTALKDTGNRLREPVSGAPVIIVSEEELMPLLSDSDKANMYDTRGMDTAERFLRLRGGFRLIPYQTVGTEGGLLLAFCPEEVYIDGKRKEEMWAAFSPTEIRAGGGCTALVNGD